MNENVIDARGLSCPQPVILTKKAIDGGSECFRVLVDNPVACENVMRCIAKNGLKGEIGREGADTVIVVTR